MKVLESDYSSVRLKWAFIKHRARMHDLRVDTIASTFDWNHLRWRLLSLVNNERKTITRVTMLYCRSWCLFVTWAIRALFAIEASKNICDLAEIRSYWNECVFSWGHPYITSGAISKCVSPSPSLGGKTTSRWALRPQSWKKNWEKGDGVTQKCIWTQGKKGSKIGVSSSLPPPVALLSKTQPRKKILATCLRTDYWNW